MINGEPRWVSTRRVLLKSSLHTKHTNTDRRRIELDYPMPDGDGSVNRDSLESIEKLQARKCLKSVNVEKILTAGKDRHFFKTKTMKERTPSGCIASTLKLAFLAGVIIAIWMLWSCKTMTGPCGDYDRWSAKTKFRSK